VHTWREGLIIKLMLGSKGVVYRVHPTVLLALTLILFCSLQLIGWEQKQKERAYQARIHQLEEEKRRAHTFLLRKDREKKQALALAQMRSDELWDELKSRDRQMEQIWKAMGKSGPQHPSAEKPRRSLSGSRSHPLALKRRYLEMQSALQGDEGELKDMRKAALAFRKDQLRKAELAMWSTQPSLWPCEGFFSSPFGYRIHPILGYARFHSGCDISAPSGTPIRATAAGRVTCADWMGGYGLAVTIEHANGLSTLYGHCSSVAVKSGQYVRKGQFIANVGSTGMSSGPHCHYEVSLNGAQIDPAPYLKSRR
jgi:murein DD-endopeptidase MepM/ murein hydrolase activator NlpD